MASDPAAPPPPGRWSLSRLRLVLRLAGRDLRHRAAESLLLLMAIAAATTTLTVALALRGVTAAPYQATRAATKGPDVLAALQSTGKLATLQALDRAPGVTASSGPFELTAPVLSVDGHQDPVFAEGRSGAPAAVDQPKVTAGRWLATGSAGDGEVVVERSMADLIGLRVGERIRLRDGFPGTPGPVIARTLTVVGIAVSAAILPPPFSDYAHPSGFPQAGMVWVSRSTAGYLAGGNTGISGWVLDLRLAHPGAAPAFAAAHRDPTGSMRLTSWQSMAGRDGLIVSVERAILLTGSSLLGLLALASVALLVGGRMEQQTRRVGLLKAVGATPGLVAVILLAEQVVLALGAAALGLLVGRLVAPSLTDPGASMLGTAGPPTLDALTVVIVGAVALALATVATAVPALRAARTSTVRALADAPHPARRGGLSIRLSRRLPVPLLLAVRLVSRRRRRAVLSAASIAVTVGALVAVLMFRQHADSLSTGTGLYRFSGPGDALWERGIDVMLVFTVALVVLSLINALLVTWATVQDARYVTAVERALGASPAETTLALVATQLLSALPGALVGVPFGIALYTLVGHHNSGAPSVPAMAAVVGLTLVVVTLLTALPARLGARRPVAGVLSAEAS